MSVRTIATNPGSRDTAAGTASLSVTTCDLGPSVQVRLWKRHANDTLAARPGAHSTLELSWIESGAVGYQLGSRAHVVEADGAIVVPPGVEHTTTFLGPMRAVALWLDRDVLAQAADAMGQRHAALDAGPLTASATIVTLGRVLSREIDEASRGHLMAAEALVEALTVALVRGGRANEARPSASHPRIVAALERIHASYDQPLTVESLARDARMNRFGFTRLFREQVGVPPYQYLLATRLERAAEQLRGGRRSVTEVALAVGFTDLGRFARMFRARFGRTPSEASRASARIAGRIARID